MSVTTPHHGVKVIKKRIKAFNEANKMKQPEPRVLVTTPHISVPRASEHTELRVSTSEQVVPS